MSAEPVAEHYPPEGVMSDKVFGYFMRATGIGKRVVPGGILNYDYNSSNLFSGHASISLLSTVVWESFGLTFWMNHTGCAKILRAVFELEDNDSEEELTDLFQIEDVIGPCQDGRNHGKFRGVNYETVGEGIDLRPYWSRHEHVVFDYKKLVSDGKGWMITRPDVFSRFSRVVDHAKRIAPLGETQPGNDMLTSKPLDVIRVLLPYLSVASYLKLTSTCKYLRYQALTSFQPHARTLLLSEFPWAFPTRLECESIKQNKDLMDAIVSSDPKVCGPECDWLLYMYQVHKTKSMRIRRYIWSICVDMRREYEERLPGSGFYEYPEGPEGEAVGTQNRKALEGIAQQLHMFGKLGSVPGMK
ncbi:hypothetical protein V5O48_000806 [Marasmius crinis-equi]|uniref:F-box domain-containing protein n=1 Tax=Marasmius crinis-equi TaxID=585013 RepID=A0ABR3G0A0_9AGAR